MIHNLRQLLLVTFFILHFLWPVFAQTDNSHLRLSLLTCSSGEDLYSTWGHSALRVTDSLNNSDIVYNYGTFNFDEPGFYKKFILGKLTFYVSTADFDSFLYSYREENRGVIEQVLNLSPSEKAKMLLLLHRNMMPQNMFYKYDFTFDNCTTRLRDLVEKSADSTITYHNVLQQKATFRQLIYQDLDYNDNQWSKLGIDLLLGSKTDAIMTNRQVMFLPGYLMRTFNNTRIGNTPLVLSSQQLYSPSTDGKGKNYITHPEFIFTILLIVMVALSFSKNPPIQRFVHNFDGVIFFITGSLGILILFMWFGTDHLMCRNNYNILWAWPVHVIGAFYINRHSALIKTYFKLSALLNCLLLLSWFFLPQHLNISVLPLVLLLIFRSAVIAFNPRY